MRQEEGTGRKTKDYKKKSLVCTCLLLAAEGESLFPKVMIRDCSTSEVYIHPPILQHALT